MPSISRLIFIGLLSVLHGVMGYAQAPQQLRFETLTVNDGLSQGYVSGVIQDRKGFMWFATNDGLNRYDGYGFTIFRHNTSDTTSLADNAVRSVFEDSKGRLWVGTAYNGLDLFDRQNGRFTHFPIKNGHGPQGSAIIEISEDHFGSIWLRTSKGLERLQIHVNEDDKVEYHFQKIASQPTGRHQPNVLIAKNGIFIVSPDNVSEFIADPKVRTRFRVKVVYYPEAGRNKFAPRLIEDTLSKSYLLATDFKVIRFNDYDFAKPKIIYQSHLPGNVRTIDKDGFLWIAGSAKFTRIHMVSGRQQVILTEPSMTHFVSHSIDQYMDPGGVIWIPTGGYGLLKYHAARDHFHNTSKGNNTYQIMPFAGRKAIVAGRYILDIDRGVYKNQAGSIFPDSNEYFNRSVACVSNDQFWINSEKGILKMSLSGKILQTIPLKLSGLFPLYAGQHGQLWAGSDSVLVQLDTTSKRLRFHPIPQRAGVGQYVFVQQILQDRDGTIWLATVSGLMHFDPATEKWVVYINKANDPGSLNQNFLISLCADPDQPERYLWIGTQGGGLNRLDKTSGKFNHYTQQEGLPNNTVYAILADKFGHLWMSTNNGITDFNPKKRAFRNYTSRDGLQHNEFNRYASAKRNDTLYFGGINGINYFLPEQIRSIRPPNIFLTELKLFNKPVDPRQLGMPHMADISYAKSIELQYNQNMVGLTFAAADYSGTGRIRYRYRLNGLENEWIVTATSHEATYTNLNPGQYTFLAQASLDGIEWGAVQTLLTFEIIAPFWRTWYFYLLVSMLILLITYGIYQYRLRQIMQVQHLRNQISRDLHDEIGSSLSTISIYSKVASAQLENANLNPQALLIKISENSQQAMEAMSDIIWSTNAENDQFKNIINRMREHAVQLFEAKNYVLHFKEDESIMALKLDMAQRKDFYLIYKEALNNIAKHAHGQQVWIDIGHFAGGIRLAIRDDGQGFDRSGTKSGNGISNMQNRAKTLNGKILFISQPEQGSSIILEFPV